MRPLSHLLDALQPDRNRPLFGRAAVGALVVGGMLSGLGGPVVAAQNGTPAAGEMISAAECTVEPLTDEYLAGLAATPEAAAETPEVAGSPAADASPGAFTPPSGEPASEEETAGVTDTVRQVVACLNAADYRRVYALYSEAYLTRNFSVTAPAEAQATPNPENEAATAIGLIAVEDVIRLEDGRVGAQVTLATAGGERQTMQYSVFVLENDRYLIDEETVIDSAATPAA